MFRFCYCTYSDYFEQITMSHYCKTCSGVITEKCDENCSPHCEIAREIDSWFELFNSYESDSVFVSVEFEQSIDCVKKTEKKLKTIRL
jgi:hypothetical protein